jgi:SAM-dependent methyltransferase
MSRSTRPDGFSHDCQINSAMLLERTFSSRGEKYAAAGVTYPFVRQLERKTLLDLLDICEGDLVVDLQAAAGFLANGIKDVWGNRVGTICVEPTTVLRAKLDTRRHLVLSDPLEDLSIPNCFVTKVGCLAGTHHAPKPELLFLEASRILKTGGVFAVAEAKRDSPIDQWLNGFLDRELPEGHQGIFPDEGAFSLHLSNSGFTDIQESLNIVPWDFVSLTQAVDFCKTLFGLKQTNEERIELIYAKGVKK